MRAQRRVMRVAAVILAAGASTRLGEPKQLVTLAGEALIERAIRIATQSGCDPVILVLGASASAILTQCNLSPARVVINYAWQEGMASSIRAGIAALADTVDAAILMTCDQPAVTAEHLASLINKGRELGDVVGSSYAEMRGVPAYFPGTRFRELLALAGVIGARHLLGSSYTIPLSGGELDIDTPSALAAARKIYE
jgi:molybdenum cofactor cytidylyltransferase